MGTLYNNLNSQKNSLYPNPDIFDNNNNKYNNNNNNNTANPTQNESNKANNTNSIRNGAIPPKQQKTNAWGITIRNNKDRGKQRAIYFTKRTHRSENENIGDNDINDPNNVLNLTPTNTTTTTTTPSTSKAVTSPKYDDGNNNNNNNNHNTNTNKNSKNKNNQSIPNSAHTTMVEDEPSFPQLTQEQLSRISVLDEHVRRLTSRVKNADEKTYSPKLEVVNNNSNNNNSNSNSNHNNSGGNSVAGTLRGNPPKLNWLESLGKAIRCFILE